jgi:glycogen debranching enzyme
LGASIKISSYENPKDSKSLCGLPSRLVEMPSVVVPQGLDQEGPYAKILVPEVFPPGSIILFETQLQEHDMSLDAFCSSGAQEAFGSLDLVDLNIVLHHADGEEQDAWTAQTMLVFFKKARSPCGLRADLLKFTIKELLY